MDRTGPADLAPVLAAVLRTTALAVDADDLLRRAAGVLLGPVADWVIADRLVDPDLVVRSVAVTRSGPLTGAVDVAPAPTRRSSAAAGGLLRNLAAMPVPVLRLRSGALAGLLAAPDPRLRAQAELALELGTVEAVVLATRVRGRINGVLSLGRTTGGFSADQLDLLELVVLHLAVALDAFRLLDAQRAVSETMQTSLLPPLPVAPGLELAARYQAAARGLEVGGDWYDAFALPGRDALAVVVGDATGHDTAAAARMAELRNQLRALAADRGEGPAALLTRLDLLGPVLGSELSGTCIYAELDRLPTGRRLRWSSAGHLAPVLVQGGVTRLVETAPDLMLGVEPDAPRSDHEELLSPGDVLVLYTDGLVEQRRTPLDERLDRLVAKVGASAGQHPDTLADALLADLAVDAEDDVALLVVRVTG